MTKSVNSNTNSNNEDQSETQTDAEKRKLAFNAPKRISKIEKLIEEAEARIADIDDEMFAIVAVSLFMQVIGILQMPHFLGPSFNPFAALMTLLELIVKNTLWIEVDRTLNIMPMAFDNKGCHTREDDDVLVPVESATAEAPIEYSVTTVATSSAFDNKGCPTRDTIPFSCNHN